MKHYLALASTLLLIGCQCSNNHDPQASRSTVIAAPPRINLAQASLYFQCANPISLGDSSSAWELKNTAITGADLIDGSHRYLIEVVPTSREVQIEASLKHWQRALKQKAPI